MDKKKKENIKKLGFLNTKEKMIRACVAGGILLVLIVVLMVLESSKGKFYVKNNTDLKLEYVNTAFTIASEDSVEVPVNNFENIDANKTATFKFESYNLMYTGSFFEIKFKFEGHDEMLVDAGLFNDKVTGTMKVSFEETKDPNIIKMKVKVKNGLLPSKTIMCDEVYTIDLKEGSIID